MGVMLCALNELKDYLRVPRAETTLDTVLTQAIYDASDECEHVTGRTFTYTGYANETYKGGMSELALKNFPVDPNATFDVKDYDATGATVIFDTSDYAVDWENGIVRLRGGIRWTHGPDSARVTYSAGFKSVGTGDDTKVGVPNDLGRSVRDYAAALYRGQIGVLSPKDSETAKDAAAADWIRHSRLW